MKKFLRFLFETSETISPLFLMVFFTIYGFESIYRIPMMEEWWFVIWLIITDLFVLLDFSYTNDKWRDWRNG